MKIHTKGFSLGVLRTGEDLRLIFLGCGGQAQAELWVEVPISTQSTPDVGAQPEHRGRCCARLCPVCSIPYKVLRLCRGCAGPLPIMVRKGKSLCPEPPGCHGPAGTAPAMLGHGPGAEGGSSCTPHSSPSHTRQQNKIHSNNFFFLNPNKPFLPMPQIA